MNLASLNCTSDEVLHSVDKNELLSVVNKPLKDHLKHSFQVFRAGLKTTEEGKQPEDVKVDTRVSIMKPLGAKWITSAYNYQCTITSRQG